MNATDPSGFFLKKLGRSLIKGAVKIFGAEVVNMVGSFVAGYVGGAIGVAAWNYEFARAMGVSSSDALRGAAISLVTAAAYSSIGAQNWSLPGKAIAHGIVGGTASVLQGGKFGHGFVSAGVAKWANVNDMYGSAQGFGHTLARVSIAAVIGGTVSEATGSKFANGAQSAAMGQLFNGEGEAARSNAQKGNSLNAQSRDCAGRPCRTGNNQGGNENGLNIDVSNNVGGTLSVRGGFILVGAIDVVVSDGKVQLYLGAGLGAGLSISAAGGIKAGETSGITAKVSAAGGFGGMVRASGRFSESGVSGAAQVGTGGGASVSTTVGYTFTLFERE
jgi:hypothetical protein